MATEKTVGWSDVPADCMLECDHAQPMHINEAREEVLNGMCTISAYTVPKNNIRINPGVSGAAFYLLQPALRMEALYAVKTKCDRTALVLCAMDNDVVGRPGQAGRFLVVIHLPPNNRNTFKKAAEIHLVEPRHLTQVSKARILGTPDLNGFIASLTLFGDLKGQECIISMVTAERTAVVQ